MPVRPNFDGARGQRQEQSTVEPKCDRLWTVHDVSDFLTVPVRTLHQWRHEGSGPEAFRVGKHLRYDPAAVRRWLVESCASPRSA